MLLGVTAYEVPRIPRDPSPKLENRAVAWQPSGQFRLFDVGRTPLMSRARASD